MKTTFETYDQVEAWNQDKPAEWGEILSLRVALRVIAEGANDSAERDELIWKGLSRGLTNVMSTASEDAILKKKRADSVFYGALKAAALEGAKDGARDLSRNLVVGSGDLLLKLGETTIKWSWIIPVLQFLKG